MNLKQFLKKLKDILIEGDLDLTELIGIFHCTFSALWFFSHPMLFNQGKIYAGINIIGNEMFWGCILLLLAVLKLYCIWADRYKYRRWTAGLSTFIWASLFINFLQNNSGAYLIVWLVEITLLSALEFLRHTEKAWLRKASRTRLGLNKIDD